MTWEMIKNGLKPQIPETAYQLWIEPLKCIAADEHTLELICQDQFSCSWVSEHYLAAIKDTAAALGAPAREVTLSVAPTGNEAQKGETQQLPLPNIPPASRYVRTLHPQYTFEQFVVGESNLLAFSACQAIANGDLSYGPCLYIEAGTGLGKSHLAHAVSRHVIENSPSTRIHYLTAEQFTAEVVRGIKSQTMDQVKEKYRSGCDLLVLEGVHTLTGKERTQAELTDTLDGLFDRGKRVIFTGAVPPRDIQEIHGEFRSRLCAGLITSINPPDQPTRRLIVKRKSENYHMQLAEEVISYLADHIHGDIRQVESAVVGLRAKTSLLGRAADLDMAREVINTIVLNLPQLTADSIRDFVGRQYKISVGDLQSKSRKKSIAFPRQMGMYLARKLTGQALAEIGKAYNRDHSTVVHSIRVITELLARDGRVRGQVDLLTERLRNGII